MAWEVCVAGLVGSRAVKRWPCQYSVTAKAMTTSAPANLNISGLVDVLGDSGLMAAPQSGRRLKPGASGLRSEAGSAKLKLLSLASLPSFCTECGSKAPSSTGHQRRSLISLHSRITEFPPTSGSQRPCRDAGVGEIALGLAMLKRAKRASHIDPPASSYAIMRRARPYRGENPAPGKDVHGELDPRPGIREQPRPGTDIAAPIVGCGFHLIMPV